jgi:aconitate hydratase
MAHRIPFDALRSFETSDGSEGRFVSIESLEENGACSIQDMPYTIRILLEAALRRCDGHLITEDDVLRIASWKPGCDRAEIPYRPSRVLLQDFTGVPAVVDIAAMRDAIVEMDGDPSKVNPQVPVDLVIDHSIQVDASGLIPDALELNLGFEYHRNMERYSFLKWGQSSFDNFRAVPPGRGIVHQVNLEWIATVAREEEGLWLPDSLVGTDSHTTMINGLGVLGWGVGGIEAEAVMLGQPIYMLLPEVVGMELTGSLSPGVTATDMALRIVEMLREHGVVGRFVEFYGEGLDALSLPDRATIANMAPEYGATCGFFPADSTTMNYLKNSGREQSMVDDVERYLRANRLFRTESDSPPLFTSTLKLDLSSVETSLAGPKRPQDRVALSRMREHWRDSLTAPVGHSGHGVDQSNLYATQNLPDRSGELSHGSVVIAAITSCTNTSNPSVMVAAGLLAKNAVKAGLSIKPWVKPSLAPGSRVVTEYLEAANLDGDLSILGFNTVGYGCTTCIGNSGPLDEDIESAIDAADLVVASVLSGNRNFEGRVHAKVKANYLASPPLVVAYAIAGHLDFDFSTDPMGHDSEGNAIMLSDLWPSDADISAVVSEAITPEMYRDRYADVLSEPRWEAIPATTSQLYDWDLNSTYVRRPTFLSGIPRNIEPVDPITGARALLMLGDSVTTDHISPAGAFSASSSAGLYLTDKGISPRDFNSYGSRRGNHEVMMRGTFANVRIRNMLAPETTGGFTTHMASGDVVSIFEASRRYRDEGTPLIVIAGSQYGTGSSRDWAAKGPLLLGVRAVIATSFERIHRSNLVGMGILPLTFAEGDDANSLGLDGTESFDIPADIALEPGQNIPVEARKEDDSTILFEAVVRLDTPVEVEYYRNGGILQTVLRGLAD